MPKQPSSYSQPVTLPDDQWPNHDAPADVMIVPGAGRATSAADAAVGGQVSADNDAAQIRVDRDGVQYMHPHPPRIWNVQSSFAAAQSAATIKAAPGAALRLYLR